MMNKVKEAWDYFLHEPEKTEVIIHTHILNPAGKTVESIVMWKVNTLRKVIKWVRNKRSN